MKLVLSNGRFFQENKLHSGAITVCDGLITRISSFTPESDSEAVVIDVKQKFIFPGFVDVHVHLREPGFSYKETVATGTMAAAHGGFTSVCAMPNLAPVPDSVTHLEEQTGIIARCAAVNVYPYAAISVGELGKELVPFADLYDKAVAFSDDGHGVQAENLMLSAMREAKKYGKIIAAHCEENSLLHGGYIHAGAYAAQHGHKGICSESEYLPIRRDLALAEKTGCAYHVCHVSAKESVALIREAKLRGVNVTCETAPHYLVLNDMDLQEDGRFKMNPPVRGEEDRQALLAGLLDGTVDMIATDHAPHSAQEKSRGLAGSAMGVVGLETAFPVLYTKLVRTGLLPLEKLLELMNGNPRERFHIGTRLEPGQPADLTVFDLDAQSRIDPESFLSMGRSTPFAGMEVFGKCKMTMVKGKIVWQENMTGK